MSIDLERCFLILSFVIPTAVALSQCMGEGGWECPSSAKVSRIIFASFTFRKRAPSSASAAEAALSLRMTQRLRMVPFNCMGSFGLGSQLRKKWPDARLRAFDSERYDASECTLRIMSDA